MTLTEQGGRTSLQTVVLHPNKESRDGHLNAGMENGAREVFDRLEALLATMSKLGLHHHSTHPQKGSTMAEQD